ncbi:carboxylesterase/lipase family protein [Brevundimonas subvibrioides]|uniref:carboxylesterase/lipase family protein n=1 Tax=Brevundimonas subvibrioides TaxID=74313 RepID=UPI0022B2F9A5|nr:carboxylesterase family protein [Brevundimonas subvibrioides]
MSNASAPIIANTLSGRVRGVTIDGVDRFLGVPYAAAPVGPRRFELPQPHAPWSGEWDATAFGPTAPYQLRDFPTLDLVPLVGSGWVQGDECLNLNIWTPGVRDAAGLPVMVFIHGGAWVGGAGSAPAQDGTSFARNGVVCVTINYRLGIEGFLPIPGVPTNLGLRDMIAALEWVRGNIAGFGGNPDNVTVFGESAGAMSIADLVVSPLAKGLFRRAILQSGHGSMVRSVRTMRRVVDRIAKVLDVRADAAGFRSASLQAGLDAQDVVQAPTSGLDMRGENGRDPAYGLSKFLPVHGDDVIPVPPLKALAKGAGAEVDLLIGTNAEEMNLYFVPTGVKAKLGRFLAWFLMSRTERGALGILRRYGLGQRGETGGATLTRALTDLVFRWPARAYAQAHQGRTHFYEMDWRSPAMGGELGACHAVDIPFVFNTLATAAGPKGILGPTVPLQALADRIHGIWIDFARDGSAPWPAYDADTRQVYRLAEGRAGPDTDFPIAATWRE